VVTNLPYNYGISCTPSITTGIPAKEIIIIEIGVRVRI